MMSEFPAQPPPTAQSVLWRPAIQELAPPEGDTSLIFIAQRTLAAVEDHLVGALHRPLLGYLVGRVLQAPDTGTSYVVAHGVVRVPQVIVDGATEQLMRQTLAAAQRVLPPEHGVVVGWYRSDPTGQHMISEDDHRAHVQHFQRPWQFALVVNIRPAGTRGGFFRPTGDPGSRVVYLPFYELLNAEAYQDGWKRPRVSWSNYWSPDPAVWRAQAEAPRAPRATPSARPSGARRWAPIIPSDRDEDFDVAWVRLQGGRRGAWPWWVLAGAAVLGAIVLGIRLGLRPADSSPTPAEATPQSRSVAAPEPTAADAVQRAIAEYRSRESLVAKHQMTCDDLARGLADVDDQWLHYTLAAPAGSGSEDTTLATPEGRLAADVEAVEADFERSGCPRP
jgi:proteasome lid subunit RPN8/RPN11